jgi:hypothetical protein
MGWTKEWGLEMRQKYMSMIEIGRLDYGEDKEWLISNFTGDATRVGVEDS